MMSFKEHNQSLISKFKKVCSKENLLQESRIQLLIHPSKHSNILWKYSYKIVITSNDENEKLIDENVMTYELCYCNEIDMYWITLDNTFCWIKNCFELSFFHSTNMLDITNHGFSVYFSVQLYVFNWKGKDTRVQNREEVSEYCTYIIY